MAQSDVREYAVLAASTEPFGRVLTSARNHHFVIPLSGIAVDINGSFDRSRSLGIRVPRHF
jgi:hypothetical protein